MAATANILTAVASVACAYLDIETSFRGGITIIGLHWPGRATLQLVGAEVTPANLLEALAGTAVLKTYNGARFDLPVIRQRLGLDLNPLFRHEDLMLKCWQHRLKGGLKAVERQLGISRKSAGIDGWQAMRLWAAWEQSGERASLEALLLYNREDVELLPEVERRLALLV